MYKVYIKCIKLKGRTCIFHWLNTSPRSLRSLSYDRARQSLHKAMENIIKNKLVNWTTFLCSSLNFYPAEWRLCKSVAPNQLPPHCQLQQLIWHVLVSQSKELTKTYWDYAIYLLTQWRRGNSYQTCPRCDVAAPIISLGWGKQLWELIQENIQCVQRRQLAQQPRWMYCYPAPPSKGRVPLLNITLEQVRFHLHTDRERSI